MNDVNAFDLALYPFHEFSELFSTELHALDWLTDYLMDDSVLVCEQDRGPSFTIEDEVEEEHYDKKALTTTESDTGWDIM